MSSDVGLIGLPFTSPSEKLWIRDIVVENEKTNVTKGGI